MLTLVIRQTCALNKTKRAAERFAEKKLSFAVSNAVSIWTIQILKDEKMRSNTSTGKNVRLAFVARRKAKKTGFVSSRRLFLARKGGTFSFQWSVLFQRL